MAQAMAGLYASMAAPAASALQGILAKIVPQIREVIESCKKKTAGIMQPSVDKIVKLCLEAGLAFKPEYIRAELWDTPGEPGSHGGGPSQCTEPDANKFETRLLGD